MGTPLIKFLPFTIFLFPLFGVEFWVRSEGRVENPGTREKPFVNVFQARDAARQWPHEGVTIYLGKGSHYLEGPLSLAPADSGSEGKPRVWTSAPGEQATLLCARPLSNWRPEGNGVFSAPTPPGLRFHEIYENGRGGQKARHPNEGYFFVKDGVLLDSKKAGAKPIFSKNEFFFERENLPKGVGPQTEVYLWAGYDWFVSICQILEVVPAEYRMVLAQNAHTPIVAYPNRRYFFQNLKSALDQAGEFFADPSEARVYYKPRALPIERQDISIPTATRVISVVGPSPENPVKHVVFSNLTILGSDFTNTFHETEGTHGTGPWNEPMNKEGAIYLEQTANIEVVGCRIRQSGFSGISMVWGGRSNQVVGCEIEGAGFHGILLSGYRAEFGHHMDVNRDHRIHDNWIHHMGRHLGHGAGVFIWASGHNQITHNAIHDGPRYGLCIKGQGMADDAVATWDGQKVGYQNRYPFVHSGHNTIAFNDFFRLSQDSEDNGFISFWHCGESNVIANNLLHDSKRELGGLGMAIYLDDGSDRTQIRGNTLWGLMAGDKRFGIFNKGQGNVTENNTVVMDGGSQAAIHMWEGFSRVTKGHVYNRNILVTPGTGVPYHFELVSWNSGRLLGLNSNLYFNPEDQFLVRGSPLGSDLTLDEWMELTEWDHQSLVADPLFLAKKMGDFRPAPNSPVWALGWQSTQPEKAGLTRDNPLREPQRALQKSLGCLPDFSTPVGPIMNAPPFTHQKAAGQARAMNLWFIKSPLADLYQKGSIKTFTQGATKILPIPAAGPKSPALRFVDGPGSKYDPRFFVNEIFSNGTLLISFSLWQNPQTPAPIQWECRQIDGNRFLTSAALALGRGGELRSGDQKLLDCPVGGFLKVTAEIPVFGNSWKLQAEAVGGSRFEGSLPKKDVALSRIDRVLFYCPEEAEGITDLMGLQIISKP